ncbi:PH domain-containing protein [Patescibacteria group bacterium]
MSQHYFAKKISLRADEKIISVIHHHPVNYLKQIIITLILVLLTFFLMFYLFSLGPIGVALFLALLGTAIFYGAREFYIWYMNVFIITNQRIIDLEQKGFFNKTVSEASFDKILDLSYSVQGFWQTVLKLGTLKIKAAGVSLLIDNVADIIKVNQLIMDLIQEQTGKEITATKTKNLDRQAKELNGKEKEQLTEDFLKQEELAEYDDYQLEELLDYYKETFGEISLKKVLVDQLEKYEAGLDDKAEIADSKEVKTEVDQVKKEPEKKAGFTKRKL